ncbi:39S ribosomal protein L10, mitochondrial-like [Centruroides sculpturatus]|uniref:39S ribosomal protein L10, mitochondrial-like n=1 Tax=Centruroides sculpturatus TaxID=218467 RepID=UPI000C6D1B4A|nr:39S ribosomal protein L10, mitochondrial-like [Centruroides sculpturatus]
MAAIITKFRQCYYACNINVIPVRYRRIKSRNPREPHFVRKCMLEVCKPIYRKDETPDFQRCSRAKIEEEKFIHPYEQLLAKQAMNEWNASRMVCFFHHNSLTDEEKRIISNMLFKQGMYLRHYNNSVMKLALQGTIYEAALCLVQSYSAYLFSPEPNVSRLLKLSKKMPQYILLAGIIDNHFLSREELLNYSTLPSLEIMQSQICNTLMLSSTQMITTLSHHLTELNRILDQHSKQNNSSENVTEKSEDVNK